MGQNPRKRRRTSDGTDDGHGEEGCPKPKPHEELWFGDGSIVLSTDEHLYRVHKSMLAKYSTVLRHMFDIPSEGANMDHWEGVPIVRMIGDSDEEVLALLEALYNRNFQNSLKDTNLRTISSLLSISTKYHFQDIRADVMQHLESLFPSTYERYKTSKLHTTPIPFKHLFELLSVAYRCEALSILPVLYYQCCRPSINEVFQLGEVLPNECVKALLAGREELRTTEDHLDVRTLDPNQCRSCMTRFHIVMIDFIVANWSSRPSSKSILDLPELGLLEDAHKKICGVCVERYKLAVNQVKEACWLDLPLAFMEKTWVEIV